MTPQVSKNNFVTIETEGLKTILLEKDESKYKKFLFEAFKAFLPLQIYIPGLSYDHHLKQVLISVNYQLYYRVVRLNDYDLFIGIFHNLDEETIYVFNAKSTEDEAGCQVTMSSIFRNSKLLTIKILLNEIANSLEL